MNKFFAFVLAAFLLIAAPVMADHQPVEEFLATTVVGSLAADINEEGVKEVFSILTPVLGPPPAEFVSRVNEIVIVVSRNQPSGLFVFVTEQGTVLNVIALPMGVVVPILQSLQSKGVVETPRDIGTILPGRPS